MFKESVHATPFSCELESALNINLFKRSPFFSIIHYITLWHLNICPCILNLGVLVIFSIQLCISLFLSSSLFSWLISVCFLLSCPDIKASCKGEKIADQATTDCPSATHINNTLPLPLFVMIPTSGPFIFMYDLTGCLFSLLAFDNIWFCFVLINSTSLYLILCYFFVTTIPSSSCSSYRQIFTYWPTISFALFMSRHFSIWIYKVEFIPSECVVWTQPSSLSPPSSWLIVHLTSLHIPFCLKLTEQIALITLGIRTKEPGNGLWVMET